MSKNGRSFHFGDIVYDIRCWAYQKTRRWASGKTLKKRTTDLIFVYAMLLIPIIHFLIFWVGVNFNSILLAFQKLDDSGQKYWTMQNFSDVFSMLGNENSELGIGLKNTMITWVFSNLFMFPLSILWSYFIYKKIKGAKVFQVIFYLPSIISGVALAAIFTYLIKPTGMIGALLVKIDPSIRVPSFLKEEEYAMKTILIYMAWTGFAGNLILFQGAMNRIPKEMLESAELDGIGMWRELLQFIVPCMWPTLSTIIIMSTTGLFTASGPILLLTKGAAGTTTLSYWIFSQVNDLNSYHLPAALGLVFTMIGYPIVMLVKKLLERIYEDVEY